MDQNGTAPSQLHRPSEARADRGLRLTDTNPHDYEEDHLISLELGGAPSDPRNLWPEPGASPNLKDKVENAAHTAVYSHRMPLAEAQHDIATDWVGLGHQLGAL